MKPLRISRVRNTDARTLKDLESFYAEQRSPYLFPRTADELMEIARSETVFAAKRGGVIVGAAYFKPADYEGEAEGTFEFGGICVDKEQQGQKVGTRLSIVTLLCGVYYADEFTQGMAVVHQMNNEPHALLTRLGFTPDEGPNPTVTLPAHVAAERPRMATTSEDGSITGNKWRLNLIALKRLAVDLERMPIGRDIVLVPGQEDVGTVREFILDIKAEMFELAESLV